MKRKETEKNCMEATLPLGGYNITCDQDPRKRGKGRQEKIFEEMTKNSQYQTEKYKFTNPISSASSKINPNTEARHGKTIQNQ